jgi:predicted Zn finger-like uncharacterized protein
MKIQCPGCQAEYQLDEKRIPAAGATVPCRKCQAKISVKPPEAATENAPDQKAASPPTALGSNLKGQAAVFTEKAADYGEKLRTRANALKSKLGERKVGLPSTGGIPGETKSRLNGFFFFSFKLGKLISAVSLVLFFLVFIGAIAFYLLNQAQSFSAPDYEQARRYIENESQGSAKSKNHSFAKVDEKRKAQDKYDKVIRKVIAYGFKEEAYDMFLDEILKVEDAYRDDYIYGLEKYLANWSDHKKQKPNAPDLKTAYPLYERMFAEKLQTVELAKQKAAASNYVILGFIGVSLVLYILFLLIPLMIKIEENTRALTQEKSGGLHPGDESPGYRSVVEPVSKPQHDGGPAAAA